ncbi:CRNN protein, partial [Halcyon senegalensis]|nr:CRNN protein [Halcyon senegalensis]
MAQLRDISGIAAAFYTCAGGDGTRSPLSREELRQLIEQEFAEAMENPQDPKTVEKVLFFLDDNSNVRVDFSDLLSLVFCMAKACYKPCQQRQVPEDGQELTEQEKADEEQLLGLHVVGRVSRNQQVPEQGVNNQVQDTETQEPDNRQIEEGETPEKDQDTQQTQEGETQEKDQGTHRDDETEAPEGDPERGEILDIATPEQDRNKAEESETPKRDQKTHQTQENEASGRGSTYPQSPEMESVEQDLNCPSEMGGRNLDKTQVCKASWQDPNPSKPQNLLPPQRGPSPRWDPKPQGTRRDPASHQQPETKVLEQELRGPEAPSCPAQRQDAYRRRQPALEQQLQQSLYQWPPQQ